MHTDRLVRLALPAALLALALGACPAHAAPFDEAFTYQGTLEDNGQPVSGPVDFEFRLFNAEAGGSQVGSTVMVADVALEEGAFTVELDFGAAFDGEERWLEITAGGTTLSPRQRLSPSPHANLARRFAIPQNIATEHDTPFELTCTNPGAQARGLKVTVTSPSVGAIAVYGEATGTGVENVGVLGRSHSANGFGVAGDNVSATGNCTGVLGTAASSVGIGVFGYAHASVGPTRGVYGKVESPTGHAGYFEGDVHVSENLGVGAAGPTARLQVSGADPATGQVLNAGNRLYVVDSPAPFVGIGRTDPITGAEVFGLHAEAGSGVFGGMYANTSSNGARPFYGYATGGTARAWTYYDGQAGLWKLSVDFNDQLSVDTSGRAGFGRVSTANRLEVEGNASKSAAGGWLANSDARIKTDIAPIGDALATLDRVRLVSFRYTDDYRRRHPGLTDRRYLNVIAQEFGKVFPDHVQDSGEKLPTGEEILQVDTYPLTIYTAAAVQELHRTIAGQQEQIAGLEARLAGLESLVSRLAATSPAGEAALAALQPGGAR